MDFNLGYKNKKRLPLHSCGSLVYAIFLLFVPMFFADKAHLYSALDWFVSSPVMTIFPSCSSN